MRIARLLAPFLTAALLIPGFGAGGAPAPTVPTLVDVRARHLDGVDRVVFRFRGGLPDSRQVQYVDELLADGSGRPVRIAGQAILRVRFEPAKAHNRRGATAPGRVAFALPNVLTTVRSGDFEAVTTYGIGLAKESRFKVFTRPDRVVVEVRAGFRTEPRKVFFFDEDRFVDNTPPFFRPRMRPVRPAVRAEGLMDRLFAGPTRNERAGGLRLLRSRAKDYADLEISDRVARIRLLGGCSSGGSTVTIADEIMPTLRQLRSVRWVKIYDPKGTTLDPSGQSDSVPECLQP